MRIGVAGVGRIGTMHAAHLASLAGGRRGAALRPGRRPRRARGARTLDKARADRTPRPGCSTEADGVLVATPTDTHPALVRACLAAGTPVLCEKPIAADLAEMSGWSTRSRPAGTPVLVGFQRRFDPAVIELRRRIATGELGPIYHVRATGFDANPPDLGYLPTSGGIFRDLLIHDLDAVPWLVGEPVTEVYASGSVLVDRAFADADDVDNAVVLLRFAGGAHAVLHGRPARPARLRPPHRGARRQGLGGRRARPAHAADLARARRPAGRRRTPTPASRNGSGAPTSTRCGCSPTCSAGARTTRRPPATAWSACASPRRASARGGPGAPVRLDEARHEDRRRADLLGRLRGARLGPVLDPATVLGEMAGLGVTATELGPPGYLPTDPDALRALLAEHGLGLVGGFLAVPLHDAATQQSTRTRRAERGAARRRRRRRPRARRGHRARRLRRAPGARPPTSGRTLVETAGLVRDRAARPGCDRAAPARRHPRGDLRRGRAVPRRLRPAAVRRHRSPADRRHRPRRARARTPAPGRPRAPQGRPRRPRRRGAGRADRLHRGGRAGRLRAARGR